MNKTLTGIIALGGAFILGTLAISFGNAQDSAPAASEGWRYSGDIEPAQDGGGGDPEFADPSPVPLDTSFSASQESDIREVVRAYLLDNPEILVEAINVYRTRQENAEAAQAKAGAVANLATLLDGENGYLAGADRSKAKVAVIELFDYHCGHCKRASGLVLELASNDDEVMVVFREFPILRPESELAAEAALAARSQGQYLDFHFAMMTANGVLTKARILSIAKAHKLDVKKLEADMRAPEISNAILDTVRIAREMGASGTPTFIIASLDGDYIDVISGYSEEVVRRSVEAAKRN